MKRYLVFNNTYTVKHGGEVSAKKVGIIASGKDCQDVTLVDQYVLDQNGNDSSVTDFVELGESDMAKIKTALSEGRLVIRLQNNCPGS